MITIRRTVPVAVALALVAVSCGGSSDDASEDTEVPVTAPESTQAPGDDFTAVENGDEPAPDADSATEDTAAEPVEDDADDPTPAATEAPSVEPESEAAEATPATVAPAPDTEAPGSENSGSDDSAPEAGASAAAEVSLDEWAVDAPAEYGAGDVTFSATNDGSLPHEFVVIQGESYESLPLEDGGAVIEDELPTGALLGRTGRLSGGSSEDLTVTLAPGNYVLLCNLGGGDNSHAGQGQRLDITVS